MAAHWPGASGPFAKPMNEIPKVVFSDSLASADRGETTIAAGDLAEAITRHHRLQRRSRRPRLRGAPVIGPQPATGEQAVACAGKR
jgi:hypothetical protein